MSAVRRLPFVGATRRLLATTAAPGPSQDGCSSNKSENLVCPQINSHVQAAINEQINVEYGAAYTYLSISFHFAKSNVGLLGFSKLYRAMSVEEVGHANKLASYLLERNGSIDLRTIQKPSSCSWSNIGTTMNETVRMENTVSEALSQLYRIAEKHNDLVTTDFIVSEFFKEQIDEIRTLYLLIAKWRTLEKAPDGAFQLNRELLKKHESD
ncbi:ferritin heavy chain B-like [Topomyia yanbarensis]|uniref:ferritin heavy chain B-like n=1 Tax=Topomyia yanbarensis TaxID=2498891 RepID=UPI00273B7024|nr:ferritin heavy chain B-like [Topomyia yanbarensis]XP_058814376.1 ferritin heavy chain B-like [Topomyia yanbarensis]